MVIQVEIYFVTSATLNGIWCIVTVSDLQQQQHIIGSTVYIISGLFRILLTLNR